MKLATKSSLANCEFGAGAIPMEMKMGDDGSIEGYASVFGEIDMARDIVMPGAFADSLKSRPASRVKMLFMHDMADPLGTWSHLAEDTKGLFSKGRLLTETTRGKDMQFLVKSGAVDGLSIGYRTKKSRFDTKSNARQLISVDLWEITLCTIPLLDSARIMQAKSFNPREMEGALRDAGISRADAVKAVGIFRKFQCDAGTGEEGERDAASDLMAALRRANEITQPQ